MSVQFKMIPKKNNLVSPAVVKYYPCAVSKGIVNLDDLSRIVSGNSSMSRADCYGVILSLSEAIGNALLDGKIVKIDSLGSFKLNLLGSAADTEADLGKSTIKGTKINYKPSLELQNKMKKITYKRMR